MVRGRLFCYQTPKGAYVPPRYAVRLAGSLDDATRDAFGGLDIAADPARAQIVVSGELDQAALHGLLERARVLGLTVIDVRRARGSPRRA